MKHQVVRALGWLYRRGAAPVFFLFDSEPIHEFFLRTGYVLGRVPGFPWLLRTTMRIQDPRLESTVAGIRFQNPVGMAAGFDHEAQLTRIVSSIGLGFESVGTVTNKPYAGNPYPRLSRMVKSRSILVNKGFRSTGMDAVLSHLRGEVFDIPIGISIGQTNTRSITTHADAIADICEAFEKAERSGVPFAYLELNISCPNLLSDVSFYEPSRLRELLQAVCALRLSRPLFIKMPIVLSNEDTLRLVDVIREFPVAAMIIGNLQHDRSHAALDRAEIEAHAHHRGNLSGIPCKERSDELIRLAYRRIHGTLPIIGCGGIFTAEDAYQKIRSGASLVQLITGLIFNGPQLSAEICAELPKLLARDGFTSITEAVGVDA